MTLLPATVFGVPLRLCLPFYLSSKGGPASSYATAGIALRVTGVLKPPYHDKVEPPTRRTTIHVYSIMYSLLHVSVTSIHHQAVISVHGHDMFSATVWDPMLFAFAVWNFKHLDDKLLSILIILSEIIYETISIVYQLKYKELKNFNTQHVCVLTK
jgi:hypothetical protein